MNVWKCVGSSAVPPVYDGGSADALIGREREVDALGALLTDHHLVTVTGRPGVGKSFYWPLRRRRGRVGRGAGWST